MAGAGLEPARPEGDPTLSPTVVSACLGPSEILGLVAPIWRRLRGVSSRSVTDGLVHPKLPQRNAPTLSSGKRGSSVRGRPCYGSRTQPVGVCRRRPGGIDGGLAVRGLLGPKPNCEAEPSASCTPAPRRPER